VTLILAALTDQYVALASDRRVTLSKSKRVTIQEDTETKTFNICGHFLMGFTGLAWIDGHRMERWVADVLNGVDQADYFTTLAAQITATFDQLGLTGQLSHAFLAVGFARARSTGDLLPVAITVSNSLNDKGRFATSALQDRFAVRAEPLGNRRQQIFSVGWPVEDDTASTLDYRIREAARGEPLDPSLTVTPLVMALRETARKSQDHVGESILFASLPKCAIPAPYVSYGQVNMLDTAAALYLPENVRHPRKADVYVPALICPGYQMTGIQISTEGPIGPDKVY
jgi:hypothetical protein